MAQSLWSSIIGVDRIVDQLRPRYENNIIPFEVRHVLADWLENRLLYGGFQVYSPNDGDYYLSHARQFYQEFIKELENKIAELIESQTPTKFRLTEALNAVQIKYSYNPGPLYTYLLTTLQFEHWLYEKYCPGGAVTDNDLTMKIIKDELDEIDRMVQVCQSDCVKLKDIYECYFATATDYTALLAQRSGVANGIIYTVEEEAQLKNIVRHYAEQATAAKLQLITNIQVNIGLIAKIQETILYQHVQNWKINQEAIRAGYKSSYSISLDVLQIWCEQLATFENETRKQIKRITHFKNMANIEEPNTPNFLPDLENKVLSLMQQLITSTFLIENHPPELVRTGSKFDASVRLLTGNILNAKRNDIIVKVSVESEAQAAFLKENNKKSVEIGTAEELHNNTSNFIYEEMPKHCTATFKNLKISKRPEKSTDKNSVDSVLDKKHYLYFESKFSLGDGNITFNVWTMSLPFVITSNVCQDHKASATLFWDSMFIGPERKFVDIPRVVPWNIFANMLSIKFEHECGLGLNEEHIEFLKEKIFNGKLVKNSVVTYVQFCKENLHGRTHTFWEWFYTTMKFCKRNMKAMWSKGDLIIGFISKSKAEKILAEKGCPGMFLLRFSEGEPGGVTAACFDEEMGVLHIEPFTEKTFASKCLSDCIQDLNDLSILYPNIPKTEFTKYSMPVEGKNTYGYVKRNIALTLCKPKAPSLSLAASPSNALSFIASTSSPDLFDLPQNIDWLPPKVESVQMDQEDQFTTPGIFQDSMQL